jgi:hypothetical protein
MDVTVRQLIDALREFPDDALVVVDGYEGGVNPPSRPALVLAVYDGDGSPYCGRHRPLYDEGVAEDWMDIREMVHLDRAGRGWGNE